MIFFDISQFLFTKCIRWHISVIFNKNFNKFIKCLCFWSLQLFLNFLFLFVFIIFFRISFKYFIEIFVFIIIILLIQNFFFKLFWILFFQEFQILHHVHFFFRKHVFKVLMFHTILFTYF